MISAIYFGAMPLILFFVAVLYHLGVDIFDVELADGGEIFGLFIMLMFWPLVVGLVLTYGVIYGAFLLLNWVAKKTAMAIKSSLTKDNG
jgi:hypothetical protein